MLYRAIKWSLLRPFQCYPTHFQFMQYFFWWYYILWGQLPYATGDYAINLLSIISNALNNAAIFLVYHLFSRYSFPIHVIIYNTVFQCSVLIGQLLCYYTSMSSIFPMLLKLLLVNVPFISMLSCFSVLPIPDIALCFLCYFTMLIWYVFFNNASPNFDNFIFTRSLFDLCSVWFDNKEFNFRCFYTTPDCAVVHNRDNFKVNARRSRSALKYFY